MTGVDFGDSDVTGANFNNATVVDTNFRNTRGFTADQLVSTASYRDKDLAGIQLHEDYSGIDFAGFDLSNARFISSILADTDFSGAILTDASFYESTIVGTDFSYADLRGSHAFSPAQIRATNLIWPDGHVNSLQLPTDGEMSIRDHEIGIHIRHRFTMSGASQLSMVLRDADWNSTITVDNRVTPNLAGTLRVEFEPGVIPSELVGTSFDLFDWIMPLDVTNRFEQIELPPNTEWDLSGLYESGEIVLTRVHSPIVPGDANSDGIFNQLDVVQILQAGKYLTKQPATAAEGDFNGDGLFNQLDIVAVLSAGTYQGAKLAVKSTEIDHPMPIVDHVFGQIHHGLEFGLSPI